MPRISTAPPLRPSAPLTAFHDAAYTRASQRRAYWRLSDRLRTDNDRPYRSGFDQEGSSIFQRELRESVDAFNKRQSAAVPMPFVRQIADHYVNHVFRSGRTVASATEGVELPGLVADKAGEAMRTAGRLAFVEQEAYILIDPIDDTHAVLRPIAADRVLWCQRTDEQVLSAIVVLDGDDGTRTLWRFDAQTRQSATLSDADATGEVGPVEAHGFAACPLLRLADLPAIIPDVADLQRSICVLRSWLHQGRKNALNPLIVATGWGSTTELIDQIKLNAGALATNNENAQVKAVDLSSGTPDGIAADLAALQDDLYRVAKVQPVASGTAPESGIARAYRFVDADVELAAVASGCERVEQRAWDLIAAALNAEAPTVSYPTSFAPRDRGADLVSADAVNRSSLPTVIKQAVLNDLAATHFPGIDPAALTETT